MVLEEVETVVDNVVDAVVDQEEDRAVLDHLILLHATGAGCVATWPVTVLKPVLHSRREVEMLSLLKEDSLNPGRKAQKDVVEVGQFGLGASMSCMTRLGMSTQWTMQDNCTSPSDLNLL